MEKYGYWGEDTTCLEVGNGARGVPQLYNVFVLYVPERSEMIEDVKSKLWFTYRKNFRPISKFPCSHSSQPPYHHMLSGGTNITCDQGWGCTLRCGQMVMGNMLLFKHLGRGASYDHHVTTLHGYAL